MIKTVETLLSSFRRHFSREGCFKWFVVAVFALMLRGDKLGVTSVIRDLDLSYKCYENLLHFFRSRAFCLQSLREQWYITVRNSTMLHRVNGRTVLVGDGVKQSKEALKMPGVKKMVQESETCSKKQFIHGHMFGQIGIIITNLFGSVGIDVYVNVFYNCNIPEVSWNVQERIKEAIEAGGMNADHINIHIEGVDLSNVRKNE